MKRSVIENAMQRRDFVKGGLAGVASSLLPLSAFADGKPAVTWAPYQNLDLDPQDMVRDEDIARIIWYAKEFIPHIRAIYDQWYGSWTTNWTLAALAATGALMSENR